MNKFVTKALCVLTIVGYASFATAQNDSSCTPPKSPSDSCKSCEVCPPAPPCKPCCEETPLTLEPCNCAYNAPARVDTACGWDTWGSVTFLYWQAKEKGLDLGLYSYPTKATPVDTQYCEKVEINFDFHPAFKVGLGASTEEDNWTFYAEYTRYKSTDKKSKNLGDIYLVYENYLSSGWVNEVAPANDFKKLKADWDLNYNMIDLELGRPYYLGKKLIVQPHAGVKGGWIDQKYDLVAEYVDAATPANNRTFYAKAKSDSWLMGPRAGLKSNWLIGSDFHIFTNVAASLTYQRFTTKCTQSLPVQDGVVAADAKFIKDVSPKTSYITPILEAQIGLGYGTYFANNEWHIEIDVGYDFNYIWNQNDMRYHSDNINSSAIIDTDMGDLMLHGLNLTVRLDF